MWKGIFWFFIKEDKILLFDFFEEKIKLKVYLMIVLFDDGEINFDYFKIEYVLSEKIL